MKQTNSTSKILIGAVIFLVTIAAIIFGFFVLRHYYSKSYVLTASIKNLNEERENSSKSKEVFLENKPAIDILNAHTITSESQIPMLVESLEAYALDLEISVDIKTINLEQKSKVAKVLEPTNTAPDTKNLAPGDTTVKKEVGRNIIIETASNGDFDKLLKLLQLFENGDYLANVDSYSLRQVMVLEPTRSDGEPIYRDIRGNEEIPEDAILTWSLDAKLLIPTKIK